MFTTRKDIEAALPAIGRVFKAVLLPYDSSLNSGRLASAIASFLPKPVKLFSLTSDIITPADGRALASALIESATLIISGSAQSKIIQNIAHYWPDFCDHPAFLSLHSHVRLAPSDASGQLASVYLLVSDFSTRKSHRPYVLPLSADVVRELTSVPDCPEIVADPLGLLIPDDKRQHVSMRDLCLLHHRDRADNGISRNDECPPKANELTWAELKAVLQSDPNYILRDEICKRLTPEQYAFGISAIDFITKSREDISAGIFPDIYSAVWFMEPVIQRGAIFRGQFRAEWGLECSLLRGKRGTALTLEDLLQRLAPTSDFVAALKSRKTDLFSGEVDELSLLAIAQHFGFATPLLDFTESLAVAAFFATFHAKDVDVDQSSLGVIFYYFSSPDEHFSHHNTDSALTLTQLSGITLGSTRVIRPTIPESDDRIRRQEGVFMSAFHPHDLKSVSIDRIYFRQLPGVTFEDERNHISREWLLPDSTPLSTLADEVHARHRKSTSIIDPIFRHVTLPGRNVIGSTGVHLYWHLDFGQKFLQDLQEKALNVGGVEFARSIESSLTQYFSLAATEADIGTDVAYDETDQAQPSPLRKAIAVLEQAGGLETDEIWGIVKHLIPAQSPSAQDLVPRPPDSWSAQARLALTCAYFCVGWDHLRVVSGLRARELIEGAFFRLYDDKGELS